MYTNPTLISIGLPVFNGGQTIAKAISAILAQSHQNFEIIISDNASSDDTHLVVAQFDDPRIKYIRQEKNIGATRNFEFVKERSCGEYFMWHSHDDWIDPDYLEKCLLKMNSSAHISIVAGQARYYKDEEFVSYGQVTEYLDHCPHSRVLSYYSQVTDNGVYYGLIRNDFLKKISLRNVLGGDWLVISDLAYQGKIVHFNETFLNRRLGGTSRSFKNIVQSLGLSKINNFFPYLMIALNAGLEVLASRTYHPLPLPKRLVFAGQVFFAINKRIFVRRVRKILHLSPTP